MGCPTRVEASKHGGVIHLCVAFESECRLPDARDCMFCMLMPGIMNAMGT